MLLRLQVAGPASSRLVGAVGGRHPHRHARCGHRAQGRAARSSRATCQLGADLGDDIEVVQGLTEGEQVVASGQFLIDSEARLKSVLGAMTLPRSRLRGSAK